nr:LapA family protein [Pseudomonas moorei]
MLILIVLLIVAFVLENQEVVSVNFLGWLMPKLPVSLYMLLSLLIGMVVGPFFSLYAYLKNYRGLNSNRFS